MHGQVKSTTQEALDHYLKKFVAAVHAVRAAAGTDALRKARDERAKAETALVKAYNNHYPER
jgi:hypothetical protein